MAKHIMQEVSGQVTYKAILVDGESEFITNQFFTLTQMRQLLSEEFLEGIKVQLQATEVGIEFMAMHGANKLDNAGFMISLDASDESFGEMSYRDSREFERAEGMPWVTSVGEVRSGPIHVGITAKPESIFAFMESRYYNTQYSTPRQQLSAKTNGKEYLIEVRDYYAGPHAGKIIIRESQVLSRTESALEFEYNQTLYLNYPEQTRKYFEKLGIVSEGSK